MKCLSVRSLCLLVFLLVISGRVVAQTSPSTTSTPPSPLGLRPSALGLRPSATGVVFTNNDSNHIRWNYDRLVNMEKVQNGLKSDLDNLTTQIGTTQAAVKGAETAANDARDAARSAGSNKLDWSSIFSATLLGAGVISLPTIVILFALYTNDQKKRGSQKVENPSETEAVKKLRDDMINLNTLTVNLEARQTEALKRLADYLNQEFQKIQTTINEIPLSQHKEDNGNDQVELLANLAILQSKIEKMQHKLDAQSPAHPNMPIVLPAEWQQQIRKTVEESIANTLRQQKSVSVGMSPQIDPIQTSIVPVPTSSDPASILPVSDGNWETEWKQLHERLATQMPTVSPSMTDMTDLRKDWQTLQHAYTWIVEKWQGIMTHMEIEGRKPTIKGWLPNIDQALYTDLSQLITLQEGGRAANEYGDTLRAIIQVAQCGQEARKAELKAWGLERIEAAPGTLRRSVPNLNVSPVEFEPTNDPQQDDQVVRINPGKGGYRLNGQMLLPGEAVCYRYQP